MIDKRDEDELRDRLMLFERMIDEGRRSRARLFRGVSRLVRAEPR